MIKHLFSHYIAQTIKTFVVGHKFISAVIVVAVVGGSYWTYTTLTSTANIPRYVLSPVEKSTLIVSVTGSGQVSTSNQIDVKSKVSGDVMYIGAQNGQEVKAGFLIAQLDARDAQKAVRDAEANLESAKIALQKLKQPADALSLIQAENAVTQANDDLKKAYADGFNTVADAFLDLPGVMTGLQDILYGTTVIKGGSQDNISAYSDMIKNDDETVVAFRDDAEIKYQTARRAYDKTFLYYKSITRFSDTGTIETLVSRTYDATKIIAEAVKSANDFLNFVKDNLTERKFTLPTTLSGHQSSLATYTSQTNGHLVSIFAIKNSIGNSNRALAEKTESLAKLKRGADLLDIASQELSVKQKENVLLDAREKLADYFIRAPFEGTIAKINVKKYDSVSSGALLATLITKQKLAELSMNEVDVAKIKVGQKATITFDAVEGLQISGEVAEIDSVGTINQGVVTYNIKISFDTQDDRVKSGMSVGAAIITDVKHDVLLVPNGAIKLQGTVHYVEMFDQTLPEVRGPQGTPSVTPPRRQTVEIGLSNDASTEIVSGLKEGNRIVTRTITAAAAPAATAPSIFPTGNRSGSGGTRIQSR